MKTAEATAEVFVTAFEALPHGQREAVLRRLLSRPSLREDLIDVVRWLERRNEPSLAYDKVRRELKKAGRL